MKKLLHLPEEKRQQQRSDMRAIDIGIRHQYHLAVPAFFQIELVRADTGSQSADNRADFIVPQHLFQAGFFHVEDFAFQRQNCLDISVPAGLRRAARRIALDDKYFRRRFFLAGAVPQLAGQVGCAKRALAPG